MVGGPHEEGDVLLLAEERVDLFDLFIDLAGAADVEKVVLLAQDQQGPGSLSDEEVGHLAAVGSGEGRDLLGVHGEFVLHVAEPAGDVAAGSRRGEAVVHAGNKGGQGAAAGVAGDAHS